MRAEPGEVFGKLTVLAEADRSNVRKRRVLCRCACGEERVVTVNNLVSGNSRSCGREPCAGRREKLRLGPPGAQAANFIYLNYRSNASKRGRSFTITREQFDELTSRACHYCGAPPSNRTKDRNGDGAFVYTGLDRVDPTGGYDMDNVAPACVVCNRAKVDMTAEAFAEWVRCVYARLPRG